MHESLTPGTRLGRYDIVAIMDAGGMGEVYRAHDAELGRAVAIKILPATFAEHPDRLRRFELEARAAAALNHPNILAVYDVGRHDGTPYIVSELLEGQTLRARLDGAALPLRKAVEFGIQIAEGLAAAHDKGIVHRDLKPENIFVTRDERLKILDFGLAKLVELDSVTLTAAPHTSDGVVLGTVGYLSPEQASGLPADHRSDIFSVGAILFEMVLHRRAFARATAAQTLTAVLEDDPTAAISVGVSPSARVMNITRQCLEKAPERRFQSARDLALVLANELTGDSLSRASGASAGLPSDGIDASSGPGARRRERAAWSVAIVALIGIGVALAWPWVRRTPPVEIPEVRLDVITPPTLDPNALLSLALSPDGEKLVFVAPVDGANRLWVRTMDSPTATATALKGTDGAAFPFWKPDGQSIGFFARGMLNRIDLAGGAVHELARANAGRGGAWSQDGTIVFTPGNIDPLYRIPDTGGAPVQVTRLIPGRQASHRFPQFLPDARHIIFFVEGRDAGLYSADTSTGEASRLMEADTSAVLVAGSHLLFIQRGTLYGLRFDQRRYVVEGDPFPVAEEVMWLRGKGAFSASMAGTVAYRTGGRLKDQLVWLDRSGKPLRSLFSPDPGGYFNADVAADGRVLLQRTVDGNLDIWLSRGISGELTRATDDDKAAEWCAVWAPGGRQFAFASNRTGRYDLYRKPLAGPEEVLLKSSDTKIPTDWSRDGRFILFRVQEATRSDLWVLPLTGSQEPFPFVQTRFDEREGQFSPDTRWVAYQSDESGRYQIYLQAFPGPGEPIPVTADGGTQPRWRPDGRELFYISPDLRLMALPVELNADAQLPRVLAPVPLFQTHISGGAVPGANRQQYSVSADGQQFLMSIGVADTEVAPHITMVLNWKPGRSIVVGPK